MISVTKALSTVYNLLSPSKTMTSPQDMATFESRLATFETTHATTKKRASNAKGTKGVKWPHATPSPSQVGYRALLVVATC